MESLIVRHVLACPLCKETVRDQATALADGFSVSVLVMLGTLFALAGLAIFLFWRAARASDWPADTVSGAGAPAPPVLSGAPPAHSR